MDIKNNTEGSKVEIVLSGRLPTAEMVKRADEDTPLFVWRYGNNINLLVIRYRLEKIKALQIFFKEN